MFIDFTDIALVVVMTRQIAHYTGRCKEYSNCIAVVKSIVQESGWQGLFA